LSEYQEALVRRAAAYLRPAETAKFERALAGQLDGLDSQSDDAVRVAVQTALARVGVALGRGALLAR
jgi:hypothetical protein